MRRVAISVVCRIPLAIALLLTPAAPLRAQKSFVNFETGHVRPLALASDGERLFAVNTPDNRLAVFRITPDGLALEDEVPVGLEPVAVAARRNARGVTEAWVVNHLSDTVTVVELTPGPPYLVTKLLRVGDEPRDIVVAGPADDRVFVTAAHRGPNRPGDPQLTTPGVGRADVWVFDAEAPGPPNGGAPLGILELFGDTPRALARTPDGATVYAAVFHSGNQTTTVPSWVVTANGGLPPPPPDSPYFPNRFPKVGLIVKVDPATGRWLDELSRDWSPFVPFTLPDYDVFAIDATAPVPVPGARYTSVGTTLFNLAVRPSNGHVFVTNLEARNAVRFEPMLRGHLVDNRITVIAGDRVTPVQLNPHIDYTARGGDPAVIARSLAFPMDLAFSPDGRVVYVVAFGSGTLAALDADALEAGAVGGEHIGVGAGPSGVVVDASRDRLYVMNRLDHTISVVREASNPGTRTVAATVSVGYDPTPKAIRRGRPFLYDARTTSAYGDAACASCHTFGDMDHLAWDLGDPYGRRVPNRNPKALDPMFFPDDPDVAPRRLAPFHPMKGPMTTQSLRGLADAGPMHWRGDRTGAVEGQALSERAAFMKFNRAFVSLLGRRRPLLRRDMQAFTNFILTVPYPPNPIASPQSRDADLAGRNVFIKAVFHGTDCDTCHATLIGTRGRTTVPTVSEPQEFKVPHLRNVHQKIGMFGVAPNPFGVPASFVGPQIRGFGFLHDGSIPTLFTFLRFGDFELTDDERHVLETFLLIFSEGLGPNFAFRVGVQGLQDPTEPRAVGWYEVAVEGCIGTMHTVVDGRRRGFLQTFEGSALGPLFRTDRRNDPAVPANQFAELARTSGAPQLYLCVPTGTEVRMAVDRDEDGVWDGDEVDAGTDPADPKSVPSH